MAPSQGQGQTDLFGLRFFGRDHRAAAAADRGRQAAGVGDLRQHRGRQHRLLRQTQVFGSHAKHRVGRAQHAARGTAIVHHRRTRQIGVQHTVWPQCAAQAHGGPNFAEFALNQDPTALAAGTLHIFDHLHRQGAATPA